jgi:hypothetical protein
MQSKLDKDFMNNVPENIVTNGQRFLLGEGGDYVKK